MNGGDWTIFLIGPLEYHRCDQCTHDFWFEESLVDDGISFFFTSMLLDQTIPETGANAGARESELRELRRVERVYPS